jgi:predicted nucleic acid-binding protein
MIIDASVLAKRYIAEKDSKKAIELLDLDLIFHAPILLVYEIGNVLWQHPDTDPKDANLIFDLGIELHDPDVKSISRVASKFKITFYDAAYVALIDKLNIPFITADKKLFKKVKTQFDVILLNNWT